MQFQKATKEQARLRLALFGPSGSGKTFTGLRMAAGLGGTVAVIDTERGSASKYADRFEFDVLDLPEKDIATYVQAITLAGKAGYAVLIIDSLTHAWHDLLGEVEQLARAKYRGNTWSAWSEGTPKQRALVDAILDFPGHVIATMRTKTEWTVTEDRGKTKPVRVGLAPEQGKGIEYEFDLLMELTPEHIATIIKDRTGKYQDQIIDKPGEELGRALSAWLSEGAAPTQEQPQPRQQGPANGGRPYTAIQVRGYIRKKSGAWLKGPAGDWSDAQRNDEALTPPAPEAVQRLAAVMSAAVKSPTLKADDVTERRHGVISYVAGVASTSQLSAQEVDCWLGLWADGFAPNQYAPFEAAAVYAAFQEQAGQMELPPM